MPYEFKTTFWMDFTIAEAFGKSAIKDTYKRAFDEWKSDHIYLTELVMVLNWKGWDWWNKDDGLCKLYAELYEKAHRYALRHLKGDELSYYLRTTD